MYGTHPPSSHPLVRGWRSIRRMATSGLYESRHSATIDITRDTIVRNSMPLTSGTRLGPYELLTLIGAGGMGEVYKARDTRLDRIVAVKVSRTEFSERFEREARSVAALNDSNICQLYDVGPNFLVMEYIEGTPLKGPLPLDLALKYAVHICLVHFSAQISFFQ
jgi:serine/threonine protein kinase